MTTANFAITALRILGIYAIGRGIIGGACSLVLPLTMDWAAPIGAEHDTWYVLRPTYYASAAPGMLSTLVGIFVIAISKPLGILLTRNLKD